MESDLLARHEARFRGFVAPYRKGSSRDAAPMELKLEHSLHVLDNARAIAAREVSAEPLATACLLAALYHDLGRFPQYERWATFRDIDSANHAHLGALHLKRSGLIHDLDPCLRRRVMAAVVLHNRLALPPAIPEEVRAVTNVVRDADKLDILRVMLDHLLQEDPNDPVVMLSVENAPEKHSESILNEVLARRPGDYRQLRYVNDFIILICGWAWALEYETSRSLLRERNLVGDLLDLLPRNPRMDELRASLDPFVHRH